MNTLKNSVRLIGYLGSDPEIIGFGDNKKLAKVSLATHNRFRNQEGEWAQETQWHNLVFWRKLADFAEKNLKKGLEISIEGRLVSRSYVDPDEVVRYVSEVSVNEILVLRRPEQDA